MRKLLLSLGAGLLALTGFTAKADESGTGKLTASAQYYSSGWVDTDVSIDVKGTYQVSFKGLNIQGINLPDGKTGYTNDLYVKLDPATGNVTGTERLAYNYGQGMPCYYADYVENVSSATNVITGKLENTGVNECTLTLNDWGDLMYYQNKPYTWNQAKWYNTKIVFNFAIPDLPAYVEPTPEPTTNGSASYTFATWDYGDIPYTQAVIGSYKDNVLTISNLIPDAVRSNTNPLNLTVNTKTGELEGLEQLAYAYNDRSYGDLNVYYANNVPAAERVKKINGTVENIEGGKCKVILNDWCELSYRATGPILGIISEGTFKNTEIIFDFAIEDLVTEEPEPTTNGSATYTFATWDYGDVPYTQPVIGSYKDNVLTISNLIPDAVRSNTNPLNLTVNTKTGELEGLEQLAYAYNDRSYGDLNVYYANNVPAAERVKKINGTVENIEGGKCKVILNDWCELSYRATGPILGIISEGTFKNTEIIFDFAIEDLVIEEPEPDPIKGTAKFTSTIVDWDNNQVPWSGNGATLDGEYLNGTLTVSKIPILYKQQSANNSQMMPLVLEVNLTTGDVVGTDQQMYSYPGYSDYDAFYCDNDKKDNGRPYYITGKLYNVGDGTTKLILTDFCEKTKVGTGRLGNGIWTEFTAIFNFEIPELTATEPQPEPEPKANGKMTYTYNDWSEDIPGLTNDVIGSYEDGVLTIEGLIPELIQSNTNPLSLTVNKETGELEGLGQRAYITSNSYYGGDLPVYYADFAQPRDKKITGKVENIEDGKCKVTLSDWCELVYYSTDIQAIGVLADGYFKNTEIIFDFAIDDLKATEPEPETKVNVMTANYYKPDGNLMTYENVTGEYDATSKTLTLKNVANKSQYPLVLNVDSEGNLESNANQLSSYEDGLEMYYSDSTKKDNKVYGTIENGENTATIKLADWGDYIPDFGMFYSQWFNTVIVLDHTIELPTDDVDPEPEPGDYIKCVLTSVEYQNGTLKFSDDNVLGVGTGLAPNGNSSYGGYFKLRWTPSINQYGTNKDGLYYYILPANIDPDTKEITLRTIDMNGARDNHIKFDFSNESTKVYDGLYNASSNEDPGSRIDNSCIVIASYYDNEMKDFKKFERAFYLKGGEFLGDTNGNMPSVSQFGSITFEAGKQYQWELLLDEIDITPAPAQGETITGLFTAKKTADNPFEFTADNPFGIKFRLKETRIASYGNYWKLRWTADSQYDSNPKDGLYYYLLPATINPDTRDITLNEMDAYANHIAYDYTDDSTAVREGLYKAASHTDNGSQMDNACVVIASYHKSGMTDFNKIERAFYLKGGEFKGDTNGVLPGKTVKYGSDYIDFKDGVEYQWELTFEEIPLEASDEGDYASGKGNFKSLYTQTGGAKDELRTAQVDGVYNNGKLRVDKLPTSIPDSRTYCWEINFTVDLENGTATATDQTVNSLLMGSSYENLYFAAYPGMEKTVTGSFVNIGGGKSQLTLDDWCEMYNNSTINGIYWAKTKIVFDFEVKGLKMGTEVDDPEVSYVPTVNYMTANVGSEAGSSKLYEPVTGVYNETAKTITLSKVAGKADNCPLTLNVLDNEGTLESKGNEASSHEYDSEGVSIYYSDINRMNNKVYGKVTNRTDGTCEITLDAWGDYIPDFEDFANGQKWYNTLIVLDISIPGLPNYSDGSGENPEPGVQGGTVEGEWQFDVEDLYNGGISSAKWTATLSDGMLHFTGNEKFADFYAEYYSDGTVLIPGEEIFIGVGGSRNYDLYQIGFSNYSMVDRSYDAQDVTGQFDSSKGTMAFTTSPREGILWRAYLDGELAGGYDMLSFVRGTQLSKSESEPGLEINEEEITCTPTEFFADVIVPIHTTGLPMDTEITVTYSLDEGTPTTKVVQAGNNLISLMGLSRGTDYVLTLYAESGELKSETITYSFRTLGESTGIDSVTTDNGEVRYFNLQGIEIFNPTPGTICIKVEGNKAERIMVR